MPMPKTRQEEIDELLKAGSMSVMTECAMGSIIADSETAKKIKIQTEGDSK